MYPKMATNIRFDGLFWLAINILSSSNLVYRYFQSFSSSCSSYIYPNSAIKVAQKSLESLFDGELSTHKHRSLGISLVSLLICYSPT